jgi:hypothetical protein
LAATQQPAKRRTYRDAKQQGGKMDNINLSENINPISDLISDDVYAILSKNGLIDKKSVRDFIIRRKFVSLRANNINSTDAIEALLNEYSYLQYDTIRKIVYQRLG